MCRLDEGLLDDEGSLSESRERCSIDDCRWVQSPDCGRRIGEGGGGLGWDGSE